MVPALFLSDSMGICRMHDSERSCVTKLCSNFEPSCLATAAEFNVCAGLNMLMDAKTGT